MGYATPGAPDRTISAQNFGAEGWATKEAPFDSLPGAYHRAIRVGDFVVPPMREIIWF
jgi:hypothetical protein